MEMKVKELMKRSGFVFVPKGKPGRKPKWTSRLQAYKEVNSKFKHFSSREDN